MQRNRGKQQKGKTRDLFKKIRHTKGTFHGRIESIKDRNGMNLQKQKILRRGGNNTQKKYIKKIFMTDNHSGVCDHSPRARHPGM